MRTPPLEEFTGELSSRTDYMFKSFGDRVFTDLELDRAHFLSCDLEGCVFEGCSLRQVIFMNCKLGRVTFRACSMYQPSFVGCDLTEARFEMCEGEERHGRDFALAEFTNVKAPGICFERVEMRSSDFAESDFRNSYWLDCSLGKSQMRECNLMGALMDEATCSGLKIVDSVMPDAPTDDAFTSAHGIDHTTGSPVLDLNSLRLTSALKAALGFGAAAYVISLALRPDQPLWLAAVYLCAILICTAWACSRLMVVVWTLRPGLEQALARLNQGETGDGEPVSPRS